eukprot:TRINITY_DN13984_c0_g1_i1.p1 TRINITY_DN13984_c0_g1~~TRINITY_DN13984_c0_g1_i1.p1  ORF type:complete len:299 (+),score=56.14 TRINITY_DN13984_c0_g1_i1:144-1040(+)
MQEEKKAETSRTTTTATWAPPKTIDVLFAQTDGNKWTSINRPTAGARSEKELPVGDAPLQLYSLATPNGHKVSILLEELGVKYDAHTIDISQGDQFTSGFVGVNPNSKIPALVDREGAASGDGSSKAQEVKLFESGSIVLYLAEKYQRFLPTDTRLRAEVMNWVFWQMAGQGPMGGNFGHFFNYAPADKVETRNYGVARYGMEVQRLCDVMERHLAQDNKQYLVGNEYTIADIMCYPWFHAMYGFRHNESGVEIKEFLNLNQYTHLLAWHDRITQREAVQRGLAVCGWQPIAKAPENK